MRVKPFSSARKFIHTIITNEPGCLLIRINFLRNLGCSATFNASCKKSDSERRFRRTKKLKKEPPAMFGKEKKLVSGNNAFVFPDVCKSPATPSPVPVPYPNIGQVAQASAIPETIKVELEAKFSTDLSDVKIHENHAPTLLGAKAFTSGRSIFLAPGSFNVMAEGKELIAHECAHVVQQTQRVVNEAVQDTVSESNSNDASNSND